ncbi:Cytochrome P450 52A13 [Yarrowia sp. C11]|nr:Cytochrome P450 52A13 [Yarrowia sp. C11]KAG5370659.1 Cytochrome P450 52A13 [Yarrowia sp. E02]
MSNALNLSLALGVFLVAYYGFTVVQHHLTTNKLEKKWKCGKPKDISRFPFSASFFIPFLVESKKNRMLEFVQWMFESQVFPGYTCKTTVFGVDMYHTVDPENLKAVLATQFKDFCLGERHAQFLPVLGNGIFTLDGQGWQHSRAMLRPQFARDQVSDVEMIEEHIQYMTSRIPKDGSAFDAQELFFNLTLDTATEFLFGQSVGSQTVVTNPTAVPTDMPVHLRKSFQEDFNTAQEHLGQRARLQFLYWAWRPRELYSSGERVHAFVDHYVKKALEESEKHVDDGKYVFLRELAKETKDPIVLRDQALNILLAGRDTTASLLSWCLYLMARRPEVYAKLREEVFENLGDGEDLSTITFESLKRCDYLRYVLNEVLRLYPSVPANMRYATRDTTLPRGGGPDGMQPIVVRKGNLVSYHVFTTHRLKEFWGEDAEEFRPERWYEDGASQAKGWEYLPFNGGPRICLGQQYALTEAGYALARIVQLYDTIENADDKPEPPVKFHALTMCHHTGVLVKLYNSKTSKAQ